MHQTQVVRLEPGARSQEPRAVTRLSHARGSRFICGLRKVQPLSHSDSVSASALPRWQRMKDRGVLCGLCTAQPDSDSPHLQSQALPIPKRTEHRDAMSVVSPRNLHHTSRTGVEGLTAKEKMTLRATVACGQEESVAGGQPGCQGWVWLEMSTINLESPVQGMRTLVGGGASNTARLKSQLCPHPQEWGRTSSLAFLSLVSLDSTD